MASKVKVALSDHPVIVIIMVVAAIATVCGTCIALVQFVKIFPSPIKYPFSAAQTTGTNIPAALPNTFTPGITNMLSPTIYTLTPSIAPTITTTASATPTYTPTPTEKPTPTPLVLPITEDFNTGISDLWVKSGRYTLDAGWLKGAGDPFAGDLFIMTLNDTLTNYTISFECKGCGISYSDDVVFLIADTLEYNVGRVHMIRDLTNNRIVLKETGYVADHGVFEIRIKGKSINSYINGMPVIIDFVYGDNFSGPLTIRLNTHGVEIDNLMISPSN